jgi:hypothetical protein
LERKRGEKTRIWSAAMVSDFIAVVGHLCHDEEVFAS